jgi:cyclic pyranopterin phosphate synthase
MGESIPLRVLSDRVLDRYARPMRDLRISVIDRCNFRCPYCMPEERYPKNHGFLPKHDRLSCDEIVRLAQIFVSQGVSKIRLTGGEPLLRPDLVAIVDQLVKINGIEDLALTTNGMLLKRDALALKQAGLHRITISLDSVDADVFARMSGGLGSVEQVMQGIEEARKVGFERIKINAVIIKGDNDHSVLPLLEKFRGTGIEVRFIEYMDVGTCNGWSIEKVISSQSLVERIHARWPIRALGRSYRGEVAERYEYEDGAGHIGFVSSVTAPFCGDCQRARIAANGAFYTCLFASNGVDLRMPLRQGASDAELLEVVKNTWQKRHDRYSELRTQVKEKNDHLSRVEMYRMGG